LHTLGISYPLYARVRDQRKPVMSAIQEHLHSIAVSSLPSPQKYTQHLLSGTPAFHDHAHVGVRSHAGAMTPVSRSDPVLRFVRQGQIFVRWSQARVACQTASPRAGFHRAAVRAGHDRIHARGRRPVREVRAACRGTQGDKMTQSDIDFWLAVAFCVLILFFCGSIIHTLGEIRDELRKLRSDLHDERRR